MRKDSGNTSVRVAAIAAMGLLLMMAGSGLAAVTAAQKCEGGKNDSSGRYASCMAKAQKGLVLGGSLDAYDAARLKCEGKYAKAWSKAETAGSCPSTGDESSVQAFVEACVQSVAEALGGGTLPPDVVTCNEDLTTCDGDLAGCQALPVAQPRKSGQTTCWDPADTSDPIATIPCEGSGQDGATATGVAFDYTDNGDGTITDNNTGLMWEKQDNSNVGGLAGIHDKDNFYTWANAFVKISDLNSSAFAGHSDWRFPNIRELETLKDFGRGLPAIDPVFHTNCIAGCTIATCSCTRTDFYSSSSTYGDNPSNAWGVFFYSGYTGATPKTDFFPVRAVRGGS